MPQIQRKLKNTHRRFIKNQSMQKMSFHMKAKNLFVSIYISKPICMRNKDFHTIILFNIRKFSNFYNL